MSRTLKIVGGSGFRYFVIESAVVSHIPKITSLRMDQCNPENPKSKNFKLTVMGLGKVWPTGGKIDEDLYWFIAQTLWTYHPSMMPPTEKTLTVAEEYSRRCIKTIYVGTYNLRTRSGQCEEMTQEEFFQQNPQMKAVMLP